MREEAEKKFREKMEGLRRENYPLPQFKTRTIHFGEIFDWGPHSRSLTEGDPLPPGREYGTSMSLDGCYLDDPWGPPGMTLAFPLKPGVDQPKFYLYPYGQRSGGKKMDDRSTRIG